MVLVLSTIDALLSTLFPSRSENHLTKQIVACIHYLSHIPQKKSKHKQLQQTFDNCWSLNIRKIGFAPYTFTWQISSHVLSDEFCWDTCSIVKPFRALLDLYTVNQKCECFVFICFVWLFKSECYLETPGVRDERLGKGSGLSTLSSLALRVRLIYILYGSKTSSWQKSWQKRRNANSGFFPCCSFPCWNGICVSSVPLWI